MKDQDITKHGSVSVFKEKSVKGQQVPEVRMLTFLAREIGGGNEQARGPKLPSSNAHASTLKQCLQLLRRDFLPFPLLSDRNPLKRGAPGVPGVAGVEGADGTSSVSTMVPRAKRTEG